MPEFDDFFEELSSSAPVPGGGSVAALSTAMGAALLVMVANLTLSRKRYESSWPEVDGLKERLELLCTRARELATQDERAYQAVADAMALPRGTEQEKSERREALQAALKRAAVPPLETMRSASEILDLAGRLMRVGNPSAISDVGSAALMAAAGLRAAELNVEINLASVTDEDWVAAMRSDVAAIGEPEARNADVQRYVVGVIRGDAA